MTDHPGAGHVDLGVLAEVDEGVAGPEVEQAARAHLETCSTCSERMAHLRTTRALLSSLPPEAMPESVQERIDAALERAAAEPSGNVVPLSGRTRLWNSPAIAGAAAAAAVLVLLGALVAGNVIHRNSNGSSSSATSPLAGANGKSSAASAATIKQWATGANYTAATIPSLVPRLITGTPPPNTVGAGTTAGTPGSAGPEATAAPATGAQTTGLTRETMQTDPSALVTCGTILAGGVPTVPVAVDFASYAGKPAVIFALPAVGHPDSLDIWVVRSTCSASSLDVYFRRIARPAG